FRPGRSAPEVIAVLASLTERNRIAARDGDDDDGDPATTDAGKASKSKQGVASSEKTSGKDSGGGWKRDKPSGAEVIQPEPMNETVAPGRPSMTVETLSGYGKAKIWALDLKVDLADYRAGSLVWSDMSTKLLLYGAPGTG